MNVGVQFSEEPEANIGLHQEAVISPQLLTVMLDVGQKRVCLFCCFSNLRTLFSSNNWDNGLTVHKNVIVENVQLRAWVRKISLAKTSYDYYRWVINQPARQVVVESVTEQWQMQYYEGFSKIGLVEDVWK